jgi:F-type H+-transporting ATPase subunit b
MNIDGFTFAAQIVNFLVLVAILRWLLYGPIVRAMKRREQEIADRLQNAEDKRMKAEEKVEQYEQKTREITERREELLNEARRQAHEENERLMHEARDEVDRLRQQWQKQFERERDDTLTDLQRQTGRTTTEAARRLLTQLADVTLEQQMVACFVSRLLKLDDEQRKEIAGHLADDDGRVTVRSAFDLPAESRQQLLDVIREQLEFDADIAFEQSTELVCGLELDAGGYSFGWNIEEILQSMQHDFQERLKAK